jgi:hypothetical protein
MTQLMLAGVVVLRRAHVRRAGQRPAYSIPALGEGLCRPFVVLLGQDCRLSSCLSWCYGASQNAHDVMPGADPPLRNGLNVAGPAEGQPNCGCPLGLEPRGPAFPAGNGLRAAKPPGTGEIAPGKTATGCMTGRAGAGVGFRQGPGHRSIACTGQNWAIPAVREPELPPPEPLALALVPLASGVLVWAHPAWRHHRAPPGYRARRCH